MIVPDGGLSLNGGRWVSSRARSLLPRFACSPSCSGGGSWSNCDSCMRRTVRSHRVAISNHRLVTLDKAGATFRYKDYRRDGADRQSAMTLGPDGFIRRLCPTRPIRRPGPRSAKRSFPNGSRVSVLIPPRFPADFLLEEASVVRPSSKTSVGRRQCSRQKFLRPGPNLHSAGALPFA
jgi:Putative transposase